MTQSPQPGEILTSESEMLGSSPAAIPTAQADDQWAELETVARAALAHNPTGVWERSSPETWVWAERHDGDKMHIADIRGWGDLTGRGGGLALDEDEAWATQKAWGDHIAAANPSAVLKLIEAARASQVGMSEANEPKTASEIAFEAVTEGLLDPKPDVAGARERLADGRDMTGETVMGMRVAGYRWKTPIQVALQGSKWGWSFASHWSTPVDHQNPERLFTEADVRAEIQRQGEEIERLREYDRLIDFWFSPWGAGKAAEWEDLDGDGQALSADAMLNCIRRRARQGGPDHG